MLTSPITADDRPLDAQGARYSSISDRSVMYASTMLVVGVENATVRLGVQNCLKTSDALDWSSVARFPHPVLMSLDSVFMTLENAPALEQTQDCS